MNCLNCNKEITQIGNKPKKYCSDKCRWAYFGKLKTNTIDPNTIKHDRKDTKENTKENKWIPQPDWKGYGWCKYCGAKMEFAEGECCYKCAMEKNVERPNP